LVERKWLVVLHLTISGWKTTAGVGAWQVVWRGLDGLALGWLHDLGLMVNYWTVGCVFYLIYYSWLWVHVLNSGCLCSSWFMVKRRYVACVFVAHGSWLKQVCSSWLISGPQFVLPRGLVVHTPLLDGGLWLIGEHKHMLPRSWFHTRQRLRGFCWFHVIQWFSIML